MALLSGLPKPSCGFFVVLLDPLAIGMVKHASQLILGIGVALLRGVTKPLGGFCIIGIQTPTRLIPQPNLILGRRLARFGLAFGRGNGFRIDGT